MTNKSRTIYQIILFNFCCLRACHAAANVLNPGDVFNCSHALVSRNEHFTLKFENTSGYLGVWYNGNRVTDRPFWIANRANPITDNSRALVIDETGKLKITYNGGALELYSGQSNSKFFGDLLDDGNFVLKKAKASGVKEQILWQSFDFPTDSFLPGMKLGINHKTGKNWSLRSWFSVSRAAPGAFSLEWNPNERQLILKRRGEVFWTSGELLEDNTFENVVLDDALADHKFIEVSNEDEAYLKYEFLANEYTPKGWVNVTWLWLMHNGSMMDQNSRRVFLNPDWCDGNSITSGCKRWKGGPKCRRAGLFQRQRLATHNITDSTSVNNINLTLSDCKDICWKNCSCFGTKSLYDGTGCIFFNEPLKEHPNGTQELVYTISYIPSDGNEYWVWVVTAVACTFVIGILLVIFFFLLMRSRRANIEAKFLLALMNEAKELEIEGKKGFNLKVYSISSIINAAKSFSYENKLGEGGYGPVYKGLLDGQEIAIKRLSRSSKQGLVEFKNELIIVAKLQHTNVVRLLGFCIQGEEKMLIYEYMPNKSLDSYIFDQSKRELLDWNKSFNIIREIAQALLYLHKYSRLQIIHRDLKAGNILLDKNMNPKISDFGMARTFTTTQSEAKTKRIVGTYGYMSPEYAMKGVYSTKSDVFSFGVLVLEIVSGRRSNSKFCFDPSLNLIGYAWMLWKENATFELVHPTLRDSCSEEQVLRSINVALLCVEENPLHRPFMGEVISMLISEGVKLPMPKQPAFCIEIRRVTEVKSSSGGMTENRSMATLSSSTVIGR